MKRISTLLPMLLMGCLGLEEAKLPPPPPPPARPTPPVSVEQVNSGNAHEVAASLEKELVRELDQ
jgi:hypothetical protein